LLIVYEYKNILETEKLKKSRCVEQKICKNGNKKPQFLKLWFLRKDGIMKN
jgi:hypothetical protein